MTLYTYINNINPVSQKYRVVKESKATRGGYFVSLSITGINKQGDLSRRQVNSERQIRFSLSGSSYPRNRKIIDINL